MAVDKPAGMLVHRGWGQDDVVLVDLVREITGGVVHPLHRLDRQTSGVVLFALTPAVAKTLGDDFACGKIEKTYLTLVRGTPPENGVIDHPIPRQEGGPRVDAVSTFKRLDMLTTLPRHTSWVRVHPKTGRLHQVRRHMKHLSHPVIGDANYGKGDLNRAFRENYGLERLALHAASISFDHPQENKRITIYAPLPADLTEPLSHMGFIDVALR